MYTEDAYKLQDMLPFVLETGARTEAELVAIVLRLWLDEQDFPAPGLRGWLHGHGLPTEAWSEPTLLTGDQVKQIREVLTVTEEGQRAFLTAIQSDKLNPTFFVLPGAGNLAAEFLLHLAMGNCRGRVMTV